MRVVRYFVVDRERIYSQLHFLPIKPLCLKMLNVGFLKSILYSLKEGCLILEQSKRAF